MYKILIAANKPDVFNTIGAAVESEGYEVTRVTDGMAAVSLCETRDFDVIIMDVATPKLDGISACREIRKNKQTPLIFISDSHDERDKIRGFQAGADDYMSKPLSMKVLTAKVKAIINRSDRKRELA